MEIHSAKGKESIEIPIHAAHFLVENQEQFQWGAQNEWVYNATLEKIASLCKKTTDELVQQKWWKGFRKFFVVIKG